MRLLNYECKTTFWEDFSIAERFGAEAIKDTYKRARAEWEHDRVYGTELSMMLNHKCWYIRQLGRCEFEVLFEGGGLSLLNIGNQLPFHFF